MATTQKQAALDANSGHAFAKIPQELLCNIIDYLDLDSIKSLRLVNPELAERCLVPSFLACISKLRTDLSVPYIRCLDRAASHEILGRSMKSASVTIHVTSFAKHDFDDNDDELVAMLSSAMSSLGTIEYLDISGEDTANDMCEERACVPLKHAVKKNPRKRRQDGSRGRRENKLRGRRQDQSYPERAADGFVIVMRAIAYSGVAIRNLTVMKVTKKRRCCLQTATLAEAVSLMKKEGVDFDATAAAVESLSLSVCTKLNTSGYPRLEDEKGFEVFRVNAHEFHANAPKNFTGLAALLGPMENLRELEISFYNELYGLCDPMARASKYTEMFKAVGERVTLPRLKKVELFMVPTTEAGLINFLTASPGLKEVTFSWMHLAGGAWRPVLDHLVGMPGLERLRLVSPMDRKGSINLLPAAGAAATLYDTLPSRNGYYSSERHHIYRREFDQEDIREGLLLDDGETGFSAGKRADRYDNMVRAKGRHDWSRLCR